VVAHLNLLKCTQGRLQTKVQKTSVVSNSNQLITCITALRLRIPLCYCSTAFKVPRTDIVFELINGTHWTLANKLETFWAPIYRHKSFCAPGSLDSGFNPTPRQNNRLEGPMANPEIECKHWTAQMSNWSSSPQVIFQSDFDIVRVVHLSGSVFEECFLNKNVCLDVLGRRCPHKFGLIKQRP